MSTIELERGTINLEEIDTSEFLSDKDIHLWVTNDPEMKPICGAKSARHDCQVFAWTGEHNCPGCGEPVCSYCLLLAK